MRRTLIGGLGAAAMLLVASCSASTNIGARARDSIDNYGQSSGLGKLESKCDKPDGSKVGTSFDCTATTDDGSTVHFRAEIGDGRTVVVQATNVLTPESLSKLESEAARILRDQTGVGVVATDIDCGNRSRVATSGQPVICALNDVADGVVYDVSITPNDLGNLSELTVEVASAPRS